MSTPADIPEVEAVENPDMLRGCFFAAIGALRAIAIIGAMVLTGAGAVLAYELFYFVKGIVQEPAGIVREWQAVVREEPEPAAESPVPKPGHRAANAATEPSAAPTAAAPTAAALPDAAPSEPAPAADSTATANAPGTPDPAAPETPGSATATPGGTTAENSAGTGTEAPQAETLAPVAAPLEPAPAAVRPMRTPIVSPAEDNPWLDLARQLLDFVEAGTANWLLGLAFLVAFCWILGKIAFVLITAGTKLLVDLFKVGSDS